MTPLHAVAAAIRERLLAGRPAPLPGLGTLVRQHVSARVEERADGSRVLLPPGETIGLGPAAADQESLAEAFGRLQSLGADQAPRAYAEAMDQVEARLAATGEVRLPGVGLLRRTSGGVVLGVEADLLAAVNRTYEGLTPVPTVPTVTPPDTPPDTPPGTPPAAGAAEALPAEAPEDSPLRDLSSNPGSPFEPPAGPAERQTTGEGPPTHPDPDEPHAGGYERPPAVPLTMGDPTDDRRADEGSPSASEDPEPSAETGAEASEMDPDGPASSDPVAEAPGAEVSPEDTLADGGAGADDDRMDEGPADPLYASPSEFLSAPDAGPSPGAGLSPTDVSFVDDDTLDADLDDVLAVPFGSEARLSDVLAPTPADRAPEPDAPPSAPALDDGWSDAAWTTLDAPPSLGDEPEIEDAEIVSDDPDPAEDAEAAGEPPSRDEVSSRDETSPAERAPREPGPAVGPSGELAALLDDAADPDDPAPAASGEPGAPDSLADDPPALSADASAGNDLLFPDVPVTVDEAPPAPAPERSFPWWLAALLLLLAAALLVAWLWPRLTASREARPVTTVERAAPAAPAFVDAEPAPDSLAVPPGRAAVQASGGGLPAAASAPGPPRLEGLPATDLQTLSGRAPVRADADAWTLVVLSTPSRETADAMHASYERAGYRATVLASDRGARTMYRLAVGQFDSRDDADRLRDRLPPDAPSDTWVLDLRTL